MNNPDPDGDFVRDALDGAVSGVDPTDRLAVIRARTARPSRRGWYAAGGAVLAAAAVVVAVAVVAIGDRDRGVVPPGDAGPTTSAPAEPSGSAVEPPAATTPVYYVGPGADGPDGTGAALYRYFEPEGDPLELLMSQPSDPDYRTLWPEGSLIRYAVTDGTIVVEADAEPDDDTGLALQQLAYTMQAALGSTRPVELSLERGGVVGAVIPRADPVDVLSHVSISDPGERYAYAGSFTARGTGTDDDGTIACWLEDADGGTAWNGVALVGSADRLGEWVLTVDLSGVAPGPYTFSCSGEDRPGGTTEGPEGDTEGEPGSFADTRMIFVESADPADAAIVSRFDVPTYRPGGPAKLPRLSGPLNFLADRCPLLGEVGRSKLLLELPTGFAGAVRADGRRVLLDEDGDVWATEGEQISIGAGGSGALGSDDPESCADLTTADLFPVRAQRLD